MGNVVQVNEALANGSIEEITAMALKQASENKAETTEAAGDGEQDVTQASSGQTEEQQAAAEATQQDDPDAKAKGSDKELNFAKLRTKAESLERDVQRLVEENKRLAERQYVAELSADHAQKVAEVDAKLAGIGTKFQEGDLTWEEYQDQLQRANAEREALLAASIKAQISKEMREQAQQQADRQAELTWEQTVEKFITAKPDSVDYAADEAKHKDLNTYVKALASDPDNNDKAMDWFLQEAHALVKAKHRIQAGTPDPVVDQKEKKPALPFHTLSDLPGGAPPAKSEIESMEHVSGAALTNRFMNDPASIEKILASLG